MQSVNDSVPSRVINHFFMSIDDFNRHIDISCVDNLNVLQINACSIATNNSFNKFTSFIQSFDCDFDVITVSESWLNYDIAALFNLHGFCAYHSCRDRTGGGLSVYVRKELNHRFIVSNDDNGFFFVLIEIKLGIDYFLKIGSYYRPPYDANFANFLSHLEGLLSKYSGNPLILVGDINVNVCNNTHTSPNSLQCRYLNLLSSYDMHITNDSITRPAKSSIIDHVISGLNTRHKIENSTIANDLADHNAILSTIGGFIVTRRRTFTKVVIDYPKLSELISERLIRVNWPVTSDVNILIKYLTDTIVNSTNECSASVTVNTPKVKPCKWINPHLNELIVEKNRIFRRLKQNRHNDFLKLQLKEATDELSRLNHFYKNRYYCRLFGETVSDSSRTWSNINKVLGREPKVNLIETLIVDSQTIDDPKNIAEALNHHFCRTGHQVSDSLETRSGDSPNLYGTLFHLNHSIYLNPVDENEIGFIVNGLDSSKGPGHDGVRVDILKICSHSIVPLLVHAINCSLTTGIYPDQLKIARVTPIFKKGDSCNANNYRPISVLSAFDKVFEQAIKTRLTSFFDSNNYLYERQYGFRSKSGTHTAVFELVNNISSEMDRGKFVSGLFLDLTKAFDCVNHETLLTKLNYSGVRGVANDLFRSYLMNRMQCVKNGNWVSGLAPINIGVPQGSILGPLLFLVYINDMHRLPLKGTPFLYADDSALFYSGQNINSNIVVIREDLILINDFFRINRLCLNVGKCNILHFTGRKTIPTLPAIELNSGTVETVKSIRYLGIVLDSSLNWRAHVTELCSNLSRRVGILNKLRFYLPTKILQMIYFALVHSRINYLVGIWGSACNSILNPIQVLQNRALRFSNRLPWSFPTRELFSLERFPVLNIQSLYRFSVAIFVRRTIDNTGYHTIDFPSVDHVYNTRNRNRLHRPLFRHNIGQRSIAFSGPTIYDNLPTHIKSASYTRFRSLLKKWLIEIQVDFV